MGNDNRVTGGKAKEGLIFAGSSDRHLYAITLDGQLKWRYVTGNGTEPAFLQEDPGLYKSQPVYRSQPPYLDKKKDGYSR